MGSQRHHPDSVCSRYRIWNHEGRTGGGAEKSSCCLPSVHRHRINIMKKVKRSAKRNWIQLASAVFFNGYALGYQWGHIFTGKSIKLPKTSIPRNVSGAVTAWRHVRNPVSAGSSFWENPAKRKISDAICAKIRKESPDLLILSGFFP